MGAFPPILFAPRNKNLKRAVEFSRASRLFFHAAIYRCFDDFNRTNGRVVTLQNGCQMNMAKAIILAIFADHPAARKCCLCGSACPQCFARQSDFANPPLPDTTIQVRTPGNVAAKQQVIFFQATFAVSLKVPFDVSFQVSFDLSFQVSFYVTF